ncbi:DNA ligase 1 [Candida viswanathii]|uniref:DNA ligase n=1 Tax=Candida viswanathii TaxID=5486 RepID=A0A367YJV4_9ASCO|nr:DNA ligase 1 [Candida viswanathii]
MSNNKKQQSLARFFSGMAPASGASQNQKKQQPINKFFSSSSANSSPTKVSRSKRESTPPEPASPSKKAKIEPSSPAGAPNEPLIATSPASDGDGSTKVESGPGTSYSENEKLIELSEKQKVEHQHEKLGPKIPYAKLTSVFEVVDQESSRLKITAIVSDFFLEILQQLTVDKLIKIVYLSINKLGPDYVQGLELGLGETILIKAISECYGRSPAKIKAEMVDSGDLGDIAQKSRSLQPPMFKPQPLDIDTVFENLQQIAKASGKDSQAKKVGLIKKMLSACGLKSNEAKFLIRSLAGKLRIGIAEKTLIVGLAQAFVNYENKTNKRIDPTKLAEAEEIVKEAISRVPNYEVVLKKAQEHGIFNLLDHVHVTPGIPLRAMLAKPTKSIGEIFDRFQDAEFTCEYKYDGMRAQVHVLSDGTVKVYSRNLEDMTETYPDLISIVKEFTTDKGAISFILDCEAVAWDRNLHKILPFQKLTTRKRKEVNEEDITVNICLYAFDLLYFENDSLLARSLADRRKVLHEKFSPIEDKFQFATAKDSSSNLEVLQTFLDQSIKDSCEGLMVKMLNGTDSYYEPSKRSRNWLKLKKDYLAGVGDSLDLVVIGAYNGKGKRTGTYGGFLLASYNQDTGDLETCCKIGTGFSDEDLANLYNKLHPTEIKSPKKYFVYETNNSNAVPDVWFEPSLLFEVLTADLSLSPIYKTGHQEFGKGISLRFPRFIRLREDKNIEDATSSTQVCEFYESQALVN